MTTSKPPADPKLNTGSASNDAKFAASADEELIQDWAQQRHQENVDSAAKVAARVRQELAAQTHGAVIGTASPLQTEAEKLPKSPQISWISRLAVGINANPWFGGASAVAASLAAVLLLLPTNESPGEMTARHLPAEVTSPGHELVLDDEESLDDWLLLSELDNIAAL